MRGKQKAKEAGVISGSLEGMGIFFGDGPVFQRDTWDVRRCDLVLANLLPAARDRYVERDGVMVSIERVSIGTLMEIAMAHAWGKFVVTVMPAGGEHDHIFVRRCSGVVVDTLEKGIWATLVALGVLK
jgi:hypothetical protein